MLLTYPALIYFTAREEDSPYFVHFPDFENSATQGRTISEAMSNASEYLGMMAASLIEEGETKVSSEGSKVILHRSKLLVGGVRPVILSTTDTYELIKGLIEVG